MSDTFVTEMRIYEHFKDCSWADIDQHDFDGWLQQNNAEIAKATEERIIKLLQEHEVDIRRVKPTCYCGQQIYDIDKHRIELIKGEQK